MIDVVPRRHTFLIIVPERNIVPERSVVIVQCFVRVSVVGKLFVGSLVV